eukprot:Macronucleus_5419.p1 GENE.Macronucleus_5419~~Macronucleus_5419.p1  ORF type:complete len:172 (+),score=46.07 Macronucleus_5419:1-516(+)
MTNSLTGKVAEKAVGGQVGQDTLCPDMSFRLRMIVFAGVYVFGLILSFIGCIGLKNHEDPDYNIMRWVIPYFFGFFLALCGTLFLQGGKAQAKEIFSKERRFSSITWMSSMLLLIIIGFAAKNSAFCCILLIIQFMGLFWYASTMIPGFKKYLCFCCKLGSGASGAVAGAL